MEEQELKKELKVIDKKTGELIVRNADDYVLAGEAILHLDDMIRRVKDYWKDPKEKAYQAHKAITAKESEMLKPLTERRMNLSKLMSIFSTEQKRIEAERQKQLEKERIEREEAERKKLEKAAEKAEAKGNTDKAEELREKAADVFVPPVIVKPEVEKTTRSDGGTISQVSDIEIEVLDVKMILNAVIDGSLPISVIKIDEVKLKQVVKVNGWKAFAGLRISEITKQVFRGKK